MNTNRSLAASTLALLALVSFSACGQDSSTGGSSSTPTATSTVTVTSTPDASTTSAGTTSQASSESSSKATESTTTSTSAEASSSAGASTATSINASITRTSQISSKLSGTSESFRSYISSNHDKVAKESKCDTGTTIRVDKYWADDLATGGVTSCGGWATLWYRNSAGAWTEFGFQAEGMCSDLVKQGIPASASRAGLTCLDTNKKTVTYSGKA